jgi:hypothetical protein
MLVLSGALLLPARLALAHETRDVVGGKYQLRVGFISEPAYQGLENGLELTICNGQCAPKPDANGVLVNGLTGAFDSLKVEVIFEANTMPLSLVAVPYNPGKYNAQFIPTRAGNYTFHIFGMLGPDKLDERFTSNPNTFDSVQPLTVVQFPDKTGYNQSASSVPAATPQGSSGQATVAPTAQTAQTAGTTPAATALSGPTTGTVAGVSASDLQDLKEQLITQQQDLATAKGNSSMASTLALGGLIAGVIGLSLGGLALFLARPKKPKPSDRSKQSGEPESD